MLDLGAYGLDLEPIGAEPPFASDLLSPDPARPRHPYERVGVESRVRQQPAERLGTGRGRRGDGGAAVRRARGRGVVESAEQGVSEGRAVRTPPIV